MPHQVRRMRTLNPVSFDSKHLGERAFVVGGGPSISNLNFDWSKMDNEIGIGINNAYELFNPKYTVW